MNIRKLLTTWGFEIEHEKLDRVESQLEAIKHRLEFLGAVEVAKGLYELAEKFSHFGESLHLAASSAGITVEAFQALAYSAGQANVSQEELESSLARVARSLYSARQGGAQAQAAFSQLGITSEQLKGFKNSQDALYGIADRLKAIHDPIQRAALSQEILGRGSKHMIGYLSQGSAALRAQGTEAEKLGIILSEDQVQALAKLESAFTRFWSLIKAIGASIAANIAPVFEYMINDFIKFFQVNRDLLELNVDNWLGNVAFAMGFVWEAVKLLITDVIRLAKYFGFEGQMLPLVASFAAIVAGLLAVGKASNVATSALGLVKDGAEVAEFPFKALVKTLGFVRKAVSWVLLEMAALIDSEFLFAAATAVAEAPLWLIAAAIAAVVLIGHDLWKLWTTGDWKETWIGQGLIWIEKMIDKVAWLKKIFRPDSTVAETGSPTQDLFNPNDVSAFMAKKNAIAGVPPGGAGAMARGDSKVEINAPMTFNLPPGLDPAILYEKAKQGITDHLAAVNREVQRSTNGVVAY